MFGRAAPREHLRSPEYEWATYHRRCLKGLAGRVALARSFIMEAGSGYGSNLFNVTMSIPDFGDPDSKYIVCVLTDGQTRKNR